MAGLHDLIRDEHATVVVSSKSQKECKGNQDARIGTSDICQLSGMHSVRLKIVSPQADHNTEERLMQYFVARDKSAFPSNNQDFIRQAVEGQYPCSQANEHNPA